MRRAFCAAAVQNGTCIFAGGDEKLNLEAQTLALRAIGCRPLDRTPLHHRVRAGRPWHTNAASCCQQHGNPDICWKEGSCMTPLPV